ncbi:hypothetical protein FQA39_LY12389 [Lamprigera yunnana]|nr:hypothetical protein FQA39_LY12389 [Lamprigera yunnana]
MPVDNEVITEREEEKKLKDVEDAEVLIRLTKKRWVILLLFVASSALNNMQWLQYSVIADIVVKHYDVSYEAVNWTSMTFLLFFGLFILPGIYFFEKYGIRKSILLSTGLTCLGSWIKIVSVKQDRFWLVLVGQSVTALASMFIVSAPAAVAAAWFGSKEVSTACSIGLNGVLLGVALGFLVPSFTMSIDGDIENDLYSMLLATAIIITALLVLQFIFFGDKPKHPPSKAQVRLLITKKEKVNPNFSGSLLNILKNIPYMIHLVAFGMNYGIGCSVMALLNQLLSDYENTYVEAGRIGVIIMIAGIFGSVSCGVLLDKFNKYKITYLLLQFGCIVAMLLFTYHLEKNITAMYFIAAMLGLFLTSLEPIGLETSIEFTYPESEAVATGFLYGTAQLWGVPFTYKEEKKRKSEEAKIQAATKTLFAQKRKTVKEDYTSSEEEEISLDDSSDDATYWITEVEPSAFEELDRDPEPDDFVLVQFKAKNNVFYVGKVLKLEKDTNDIEVNFLRKSVKFERHFIFPPKPDITTVPVEDIKFILPPPSLLEIFTNSSTLIDNSTIRTCSRRWIILVMLVLTNTLINMQWIQYTVIADIVTGYYNVSYEAVNWTALIYSILYIPLAIPGTYFLDKFGLRNAVLVSTGLACLGAWIKVFSIERNMFCLVLLGQTVIAIASMFIVSTPSAVAAAWFGSKEKSTACSIGIFGIEFGVALGFVIPSLVVSDNSSHLTIGHGLLTMLLSISVISTVLFLIQFMYFEAQPVYPPSNSEVQKRQNPISKTNLFITLKTFITHKAYVIHVLSNSITFGLTIAILALLNQILSQHYTNASVEAGRVGLIIVVSQMFGTLLNGLILDKYHQYKAQLLLTQCLSIVIMIIFTYTLGFPIYYIYIVSVFFGVFWSGIQPIGYEAAIELVCPKSEDVAVGLLTAVSQLFGVLFTYLYSYLLYNYNSVLTNNFVSAILFLVLCNNKSGATPKALASNSGFSGGRKVEQTDCRSKYKLNLLQLLVFTRDDTHISFYDLLLALTSIKRQKKMESDSTTQHSSAVTPSKFTVGDAFSPINETDMTSPVESLKLTVTSEPQKADELDQFDIFGKSVAAQLNTLPVQRALLAKSAIKTILSEHAIAHYTESTSQNVQTSSTTSQNQENADLLSTAIYLSLEEESSSNYGIHSSDSNN